MSWSPFRSRRRRALLASPLPESHERAIAENVSAYAALSEPQRDRLRGLARVMAHEKHWEGCGGLTLTPEMKLVIAAQAALLLIGCTTDPAHADVFPESKTILVYPDKFVSKAAKDVGPGGVVTEGLTNLGEAWQRGPVILSWADALKGGRGLTPGHNVVLHEFAHTLDMLDGSVNGTPLLESKDQAEHWGLVMTQEYNHLARATRFGAPVALDTYALKSPGEFFAVATESFFTRPTDVRTLHPALYETLEKYYKQDPASWSA